VSRHVVFVTTELAPFVRGGAGTLVARLAEALRRSDTRVTVLLVRPGGQGRVEAPGVVAVPFDEAGRWPAASEAAGDALGELAAAEAIDRVELQDFDGVAFSALTRRRHLGLEGVAMTVRFHGPADLQVEAVGVSPPELDLPIAMERWSYRMADAILVPAAGLRELVAARYDVDRERIVVAPPVVPDVPLQSGEVRDPRRLIALGRLGEVKGSHDLAVAAVPVLRSVPDLILEYVGADGWSASRNRAMRGWIEELIPADVRARVVFTDHLPRERLFRHLEGAVAVVAPSRFDSFNLAVHEARRAGFPVVVPDLAAFRSLLGESTGALVYDGSVAGLTGALARIVAEPSLRSGLAHAPAPDIGDPLAAYDAPVAVHHARSQAGLATAAGHALAEVTPARATSRFERPARAMMRFLPEPVARGAIRVVPQRLKDRFRAVASWPTEQARRTRDARLAKVRAAVASGAYPPLEHPEVTVVIPCYNQGEFVDDAILSVFEQTVASFEVVIVDDGSDDATTPALLDALDWPRTTVIHQDNAGLAGARNTGIREGRGEFVVPLDADDELRPLFLEHLVAALRSAPDAAFAHCWAELFGDVEVVWATRPWNRYQILVANSVVGCVLLRRIAWEDVGGYDPTMVSGNEDWELWVRLAIAGWSAVDVPEPLFRYRKHGVSMSVDTEARYEEGRGAVVARNREEYRAEGLAALKAIHYPLVSVVGDEPVGQSLTDCETVAKAAAARGKYLIAWQDVSGADANYLSDMAAALEARPDCGVAVAQSGPSLVRRWSYHDPDAPAGTVTVDVSARGGADLRPGTAADPRWEVPAELLGLPVQRQRPEVTGTLPDWVGE